MISINIRQSLRGMRKNKMFTVLNIAGFAVGFSACMILTLYAYREYSVDRDVPGSKNIYRIIDTKDQNALIDYDVLPKLKEQFPEILLSVPVGYWGSSNDLPYLKEGSKDNFIRIRDLISTTNDFFKLFSLKIIAGDAKSPFIGKKSAVITKSTALKLFGTTEAVGKMVDMNHYFQATVTAVVEDMPSDMSLGADLFLNSENPDFRFSQNCNNNICYNPVPAYLLMAEGVNPRSFQEKMSRNLPANKTEVKVVTLQPLTDIYLNTNIEGGDHKSGSRSMIGIFLSIALLTLLLSVINYINFSISRQLSTLKDFGIKLTNGAGINQLRAFYAVDVAILISISVVIAIGISLLALPYASDLLDTPLKAKLLLQPGLLLPFLGVIVVVWLLSTLAPLLILSRFDIQMLFGKKGMRQGRQYWRNVLTVFQFCISILLLSGLLVIQKQLHYVKSYDLGFTTERLLRIDFPQDFNNRLALKNKLESLPFVLSLSMTHAAAGSGRMYMGDEESTKKGFSPRTIFIDENFLKTFGIKLLKGREMLSGDLKKSCYINETALKKYEWADFTGKKFNNGDNGGYNIIGVVKDFNVASLHDNIEPVCLLFTDMQVSSANVRLAAGNISDQMKTIEKTWHELAGDTPFNFSFYDSYFDSLYNKEQRQADTIAVFSLIAFIITCIGLLGQIFQATQVKVKEIGIRKINGAGIGEIVAMLNFGLLRWVAIAFVISTPIAWYAMHRWLENFAYKTELSWWIFTLAGVSALLIALFTVSWQSWKAASRNPVEALRYE